MSKKGLLNVHTGKEKQKLDAMIEILALLQHNDRKIKGIDYKYDISETNKDRRTSSG